MSAITEATESVKRLGTKDWLLVVCVLFIMYLTYGVQRQQTMVMSEMASKIENIEQAAIEEREDTRKMVLFSFTECLRNTDNATHRDRCEKAMQGIRSWR